MVAPPVRPARFQLREIRSRRGAGLGAAPVARQPDRAVPVPAARAGLGLLAGAALAARRARSGDARSRGGRASWERFEHGARRLAARSTRSTRSRCATCCSRSRPSRASPVPAAVNRSVAAFRSTRRFRAILVALRPRRAGLEEAPCTSSTASCCASCSCWRCPFYLWKGRGHRALLRAPSASAMGRLPPAPRPRAATGRIWIHAVSVGEVLAARALVAPPRSALPGPQRRSSRPRPPRAGAVAAQGLPADRFFVAPFDFPWAVASVLDALQPSLLVLVETELWPNLIREARGRGIPVAVVNGRISTRSFPRYRRIAPLLRHVLAQVDLFLMQSDAHAERIRALGAPPERVRVAGNLKFDALPEPRPPAGLAEQVGPGGSALGRRAARWPARTSSSCARSRRRAQRAPALRLVLAPRHPERFADVPALCAAAGLPLRAPQRLGGRALARRRRAAARHGGRAGARVRARDRGVRGRQPRAHRRPQRARGRGRRQGGRGRARTWRTSRRSPTQFRAEGALVQIGSPRALGPEIAALLLGRRAPRARWASGRARSSSATAARSTAPSSALAGLLA